MPVSCDRPCSHAECCHAQEGRERGGVGEWGGSKVVRKIERGREKVVKDTREKRGGTGERDAMQ